MKIIGKSTTTYVGEMISHHKLLVEISELEAAMIMSILGSVSNLDPIQYIVDNMYNPLSDYFEGQDKEVLDITNCLLPNWESIQISFATDSLKELVKLGVTNDE
jgi:hypothetical protein